VKCLRGLGVGLEYGDVESQAGVAAPTRAHVARALVAGSYVDNENEAFRRYLSRGQPAFVEKRDVPPRLVFDTVHAAGGVVVLAHPGRTHGPDEVRRWVAEGMDGIEVMHPANRPATRTVMSALAAELGLLRSGGSDWHGPGARQRVDVGGEPVPQRWFDEIVERAPAMRV